MGPLSKIFGMLPGMGDLKDQVANIDEREVDRIEAIILSMTPAERDDPRILNGSRRARIAAGSGRTVTDVNQLVDRFFEARKMMSALASGQMPAGLPGMPGMPAVPGGVSKRAKQQQRKAAKNKRGVSGNPAKRNAPAAPKQPAADPAAAFGGHGFDPNQFKGLGKGSEADFELPPELQKMFKKGQ